MRLCRSLGSPCVAGFPRQAGRREPADSPTPRRPQMGCLEQPSAWPLADHALQGRAPNASPEDGPGSLSPRPVIAVSVIGGRPCSPDACVRLVVVGRPGQAWLGWEGCAGLSQGRRVWPTPFPLLPTLEVQPLAQLPAAGRAASLGPRTPSGGQWVSTTIPAVP